MKQEYGLPGVIVIEGHVQGLANTRALGRAGIPVIVVSEYSCLAGYSRYCRKFLKCPHYLSGDFIEFLIDLALKESIRGWVLLPSNDHAVYNISANIERLKDYFKVISPEPVTLDKIYNKELLIKLCQSLNIPVPLSWFPENIEDMKYTGFEYPLLIKGKNGLSFYKSLGKKAFFVKSPEDIMLNVKSILGKAPFSDLYFQNLLPVEKDKPVSFTAFSVKGEIKSYWMGVKIREHPLKYGTSTYSCSTDIPELLDLAGKLLRELLFTGVCEIEFLLDPRDNVYKLIEVNARTWLWVAMAIKSGINYPLMIYNYLNEIDMDYLFSCNKQIEWIHYITDIPYSLMGLARGYYTPAEIFSSYRKFPAPAVFDLTDILPSFAEIALLPLLLLKR